MSGIVGMVTSRGGPPDERLLRGMTGSMAHRGPDQQCVWLDDSAGFGHALLRTTFESEHERQPANLDGTLWIVADARVDARSALLDELEQRGHPSPADASDAELLLRAYRAWGDECVDHVLGDFAFAIWDAARRRLFCARDHFGVKPFYYAQAGDGLVFSNTLDCVRMHPRVRDDLNERAIGDFLLFGCLQEPTATTFVDIHRLPPAHFLIWESGTIRSNRYWDVPINGHIRYRRDDEYVEHFREVLRLAVADRLRTSKVAVWMSGGLDSTAIAAAARELSFTQGALELRAHTIVYDTLLPDEERHCAQEAADALGIEIDFFPADDYKPFDGWEDVDLPMPEPSGDPFLLARKRQLEWTALHSRVLLCGDGGDEILWPSYVADVLHTMNPVELLASVTQSVLVHRRRPGFGVRAKVNTWLGRDWRPTYPPWLNGAFADRLQLQARWMTLNSAPRNVHPLRREAHHRLATAQWASAFDAFDPGATGVAIEGRYPFFDLRLVKYVLAIPPFPWCVNKHLLRLAGCGAVPESLRTRPKTGLAGDPLTVHLRKPGFEWPRGVAPTPALARFVDASRIPDLTAPDTPEDPEVHVRPACLNYWLCRLHSNAAR